MIIVVKRRTMAHRINGLPQMLSTATGVANVLGNKGAVWAKVNMDNNSTICFINSHLAAHEGAKYKQKRDIQARKIMRKISRAHGAPLEGAFDHIFWSGDLNYRLDVSAFPADVQTEISTGAKKEKVRIKSHYVQSILADQQVVREESGSEVPKRVVDLERMDELKATMAAGNVFEGFNEGRLLFAPTFKVVKRDHLCADNEPVALNEAGWLDSCEYQKKRTPAYCDRVLWRSKEENSNDVQLQQYGSIQHYATSDHKPVFATFNVSLLDSSESQNACTNNRVGEG